MKRRVLMIGLIALCAISFTTTGVFAGPKDVVKVGLQYDPTTLNMLTIKTGIDIPVILPMHQLLTLPSTSIYNSWRTRKNQKLIDKLTLDQARETNAEKRLAILNRIHQVLREEPAGFILFGLNQIYAMQDRIDYSWQPMDAFLFGLQRIKIVK